MAIASAIAARTQRLKIGIAVQVLPLCHPLRIAEEAATVDQLSQGRLLFGVGRSGFPTTYEAYGVPYAESRDRFAETLDIIKQAWTEPTFSYEGKYYSFHNIRLVPKPYAKPHPPIRVAAMAFWWLRRSAPDTDGTAGSAVRTRIRRGASFRKAEDRRASGPRPRASEVLPDSIRMRYWSDLRAAGKPGKCRAARIMPAASA